MTPLDDRISELEAHLRDHRDNLDSWEVLGDMWLEKGHPRGEAISLTCQLQKARNNGKRDRLEEQISWFETEHWQELTSPTMIETHLSWKLRWGYAWKVYYDYDDEYLYSEERLMAAFKSPECRMLETLAFSSPDHPGYGVDAYTLKDLLEWLHNIRLGTLNLYNNDIGTEGAKVIAASENLSSLTSLELAYTFIGDEGALALAASPHLGRLTYLGLANAGVEEEGMRALQESPFLSEELKASLL